MTISTNTNTDVNIWDSLPTGHSFESSSRTITEADIVNFACLSGDYNRLHVDAEYAKQQKFGQRVAHALLVLSISSGLATQSRGYREFEHTLMAVFEITCQILKPTFIGDTIFVRLTIIEKRPTSNQDRSVVALRRESINQRGEVVLKADFHMLVNRRGAND